jgi:hypothetical protein
MRENYFRDPGFDYPLWLFSVGANDDRRLSFFPLGPRPALDRGSDQEIAAAAGPIIAL